MTINLFVRLDVDYASDDEFLEAGPDAELLFIRALCFMKRKSTDGQLRKAQLPLISIGLPDAGAAARALVDVGLWTDEGDRWVCRSWLKHNRPKAEIEAQRELQREGAERGNHDRWHTGDEGKPSPSCRLCQRSRVGATS